MKVVQQRGNTIKDGKDSKTILFKLDRQHDILEKTYFNGFIQLAIYQVLVRPQHLCSIISQIKLLSPKSSVCK